METLVFHSARLGSQCDLVDLGSDWTLLLLALSWRKMALPAQCFGFLDSKMGLALPCLAEVIIGLYEVHS